MSIRAVIVDDEPLARERIRQLLSHEEDMELVVECSNGDQAVAAIRKLRPQLVFLDVQMPGKDGFEVLAELGTSAPPAVIFVTAFDQYAIQAFEVAALDYLLKPFDRARFRSALDRARETIRRGSDRELQERLIAALEVLGTARTGLERFVVRLAGRFVLVPAGEVECIEASGNYMKLHAGKGNYLIRDTMANLENRLDPQRFVRIHRSWIINVSRVREVQPWFHGDYVVLMQSGQRVTVGRAYRDRLETLLGKDQ